MPTPLIWTLSTPVPAGSTTPVGGVAASAIGQLPCPVSAFTQNELLQVFERLLPDHWLNGIKNPGPGYELLQAFALQAARISTAVERLGCGAFIMSSQGGAKATGEIELYREAPNAESIDVVVKAGTVVKASSSGLTFVTTEDVTFNAADLGPYTVAIEAAQEGYEYNVTGTVVTPGGITLAGEIDTIETLIEDPDMGDLTILVRQPEDTSGGRDAYLDQHGLDRAIPRGDGEADNTYRARIRALPDNISPDAFDRVLQQLLLPYGSNYQFIETWDIQYQTCWDPPPDAIAGSPYDPLLFVYDDPRTDLVAFRNRWLDINDYRGGVIIVVPRIGPIMDVGMAYDDPDETVTELASSVGERCLSCFDVPSDLGFGFLQGCWDGYDLTAAVLYLTIFQTLQRIKAAGVSAVLELQSE